MSETDDESEPAGQAVFPESGPGRDEMTNSFIPGEDEWPAKTILDEGDPAAIAALSQMGEMYPEVDDLQPLINGFIHVFLKSKTSIRGRSREEIKDILMAMHGGNVGENKGSGMVVNALAPEDDD